MKGILVLAEPSSWRGTLALRGCLLFFLWSWASISLFGQLSTLDHLAEPGFWPTQHGASRSEYVGSDACAACHAAKVASQKNTPMAQNAMRADDSEILHSHPEMKFAIGRYQYEIKTDAKRSVYTLPTGVIRQRQPCSGHLVSVARVSLISSRKMTEISTRRGLLISTL